MLCSLLIMRMLSCLSTRGYLTGFVLVIPLNRTSADPTGRLFLKFRGKSRSFLRGLFLLMIMSVLFIMTEIYLSVMTMFFFIRTIFHLTDRVLMNA